MDKLSLVTVIYEAEYPLAALQARSMSRFLPPDLVHRIILVDNSYRAMPKAWASEILSEYGAMRDRVLVMRSIDVCELPLTSDWRKQQILKLVISRLIETRLYVALDAKNHFVWPAEPTFFRTEDGRPCVNAYSFEAHPSRPNLERVLRYLGVDPAGYVNRFTATVTPFTFVTAWVRQLVSELGQGSTARFAQQFATAELTEFFLYAGWLVRDGHDLSEAFAIHQRFCPCIWPASVAEADVQTKVAAAEKNRAPIFSAHRNALRAMPPPSQARLVDFWVARGLFGSVPEAHTFLDRFRDNYAQQSRMLFIRSLPYEVSRLPRRIVRRLMR